MGEIRLIMRFKHGPTEIISIMPNLGLASTFFLFLVCLAFRLFRTEVTHVNVNVNFHYFLFWLAVNGKPVLFWKGISGLKFPRFLSYAC